MPRIPYNIVIICLSIFISTQVLYAQEDALAAFSRHLRYSQVCGVVNCRSDVPLSEMQTIVREIEQLQNDLKRYLLIPPANETIELCVFSNDAAYVKFLEAEFPDAPWDRRALYIKKDGPGIVLLQKSKDFEIDLRHEMTHAIIHASIETVPIWLDEGLAKYFEIKPEDRPFDNPYLAKVRRNSRFGLVPSLERLEKLKYVDEMDVREYRESWAWVHFMIHHSPQTHQLLARYLQVLAGNSVTEKTDTNEKKTFPKLSPMLRAALQNPSTEYKKHYKIWTR